MSLRKLAGALALAAAVVLGAGTARAADVITLKLSHFVPPVARFPQVGGRSWTEKIEKESDGRLKFEIYPNGQLVGPPNRQFDAARNGITDIAFCLHGVTPGRYPMTELANLPFTWPSDGANLPEMAKRMTELAPKYLAAEHTRAAHPVHGRWRIRSSLFARADPLGRRLTRARRSAYASITNKQCSTRSAPAHADPAAGITGRAGQGHLRRRYVPARSGLRLRSLLGRQIRRSSRRLASATFALVMNPAKYNSLPPDLRAILDKEAGVNGAMSFGKDVAGLREVRPRNSRSPRRA